MLKSVTLNKKGSLFDFLEIIPVIFMGAVITIVAIFMFQAINTSGAWDMSEQAQEVADNFQNDAIPTFDFIVLAALVGMFIGSIVLAFALPTNPSLFWINIVLLGIIVIFSVALSNAYETITAIGDLGTATSEMGVTGFVFSKLPLLSTIYGIVMIVVMLGIKRVSGGEEVDLSF